MRFDLRTYIRGGEILDSMLNGQAGRAFTRLVPAQDGVLTPHEAGDLIGAWAIAMCLRDTLVKIESTFEGFTYRDKLVAKGKANEFIYVSPLESLQWWEDQLPMLIQLEQKLVAHEYVALAVDWRKAMALIGAIQWFISRHKCRPPGVGESLHLIASQIESQVKAQSDATVNAPGLDALPAGDRRAVEALRSFEDSGFAFLADLNLHDPDEEGTEDGAADAGSPARKKQPETAVGHDIVIPPKQFRPVDDVDLEGGGFVSVARATAPDGFRNEDREAIDLFRRYVGIAVEQVKPLRSRWIDGTYLDLGQRIFAFGQLLFNASFPNPESAKLREEEIEANRARLERQAEEKARGTRNGGREE